MKLLNSKGVAEKLSLSQSTVFAYISTGKLPKPKKSGNSSRWDEDVIDTLIILAYGLKKELPNIAEEDLEEIKVCVEIIKSKEKNRSGFQKKLTDTQTV